MHSRASFRGLPWRLLFALALMVAAGAAVQAADTGSVSGVVFDSSGQPIGEVTVTVSGDRAPVRRSVRTDANGVYLFQYLLPGEYTLTFEKPDVGRATRVALIEVGRNTQVEAVLGLNVQESVEVAATQPLVDVR
jgi:hypothetical protein